MTLKASVVDELAKKISTCGPVTIHAMRGRLGDFSVKTIRQRLIEAGWACSSDGHGSYTWHKVREIQNER